jgi:hypothetical protein
MSRASSGFGSGRTSLSDVTLILLAWTPPRQPDPAGHARSGPRHGRCWRTVVVYAITSLVAAALHRDAHDATRPLALVVLTSP